MKQYVTRSFAGIAFALMTLLLPIGAEATSTFPLKLMTYNLKYSFDPNGITGGTLDIAEAIAPEAPDVIALQEIGDLIREGEFERQAENLAIHLTNITGVPYHAVFLGRKDHPNNWDADLWATSHGVSGSGDTAIVSKLNLVRDPEFLVAHRDLLSAGIELVERTLDDPAYQLTGNRPFGVTRATYEVATDTGVVEVDFYSAHLQAGANKDRRAEQMHAIERLVRPGRPAFLMGDLNSKTAELGNFSEWKNVGDGAIQSYSATGHTKQIDWILYRNLSDAVNVDFYEAKDSAGASFLWSDHTPVVLDASYTTCEAFDSANYNPNFCAARQFGNSACGLCRLGEGGCSSDSECKAGLVCSANTCSVPGSASPLSIPGRLMNLMVGGLGPFQTQHDFDITAANDMMVSIVLRTTTTVAVNVDNTASAWITIDGEKVARRIRLRSNVGLNVVTFKHVPIPAGDHVVSVHFNSDQVDLDRIRFFKANDNPYELMPFVVGNSDLQAEHFDVGGYTDLTPDNDGGAVRFEGPDIYSDNGTVYVQMDADEKLQHEMSAAEDMTLSLSMRYRSDVDQTLFVELDGAQALTGTLPATPDWQIKRLGDVSFPRGKSVLALKTHWAGGGSTGFDFDHYRFEKRWESGPVSGVPWPADGSRVQAEYYDIGGFEDADDTALDEIHYRSDADLSGNAPDIWHFRGDFVTDDPADNNWFVWKNDAEDALIYTIDTSGSASDQVTLHYATPRTIDVELYLNAALIGSTTLLPSGGWGKNVNHWDDHVISGLDLSGGGALKLVFKDSGINLDWIEIGTP